MTEIGVMPTEHKILAYTSNYLQVLILVMGMEVFLNLDFTPVPILPKFVRIVTNKILSTDPYPNLEAVDPLSSSEKDRERRKMEIMVKKRKEISKINEKLGSTDIRQRGCP